MYGEQQEEYALRAHKSARERHSRSRLEFSYVVSELYQAIYLSGLHCSTIRDGGRKRTLLATNRTRDRTLFTSTQLKTISPDVRCIYTQCTICNNRKLPTLCAVQK